MADTSPSNNTPMMKPNMSPAQNRKTQRELLEAEERRRVTPENVEKTAELVKEGISVRDFAFEAMEREKAERNRRADEYQAFLRQRGEDEDEKRVRELVERWQEEEEEELRRMEEAKGAQGYGGGSGDWGEPMDMD